MSMHSEDDILAMLGDYFPASHESIILGRGDDCAIVKAGGPWAVTCDIFAEDAHFRRRYFSGYDVGCKALAVNVSDLASAGAQPKGCVVGLTLTGTENEDWLRGFAQGLADVAQTYEMALAGGDLTRAGALNVCITAWGSLPYADLRRGRAHAGDIIFLVGDVGLARVGLLTLEASTNEVDSANAPHEGVAHASCDATQTKLLWPTACSSHLQPKAQVAAGLALARFADSVGDTVSFSLMDVSDGLARDLPRLLDVRRTGLGAALTLLPADLPAEVVRYAEQNGLNAAEFAFQGGEDYALLGSCPARHWDALQEQWQTEGNTPLRRIGTVIDVAGVCPITLNGRACHKGGFDHFSG